MIEPPNIDALLRCFVRRGTRTSARDITSEGMIPGDVKAVGTFLAKERGVLCGMVLLGHLAAVYSEAPSPRPSPKGRGEFSRSNWR